MTDRHDLNTQIELLQTYEVELRSEVAAQLRVVRSTQEHTSRLREQTADSLNAGQLFYALHLLSGHARLLTERSNAVSASAAKLYETTLTLLTDLARVSNERTPP